ncbi:hypothetical protein D6D24_09192 [Aureobasidium pullulans]|uniref:F-box domain-containing protein n=1 Tax=Aureobasidium pullulans TaxID=5580 RepID=A0A4S8VDE8_AURPU|nr:hypothetical protein D6D24_09192 [Aureobasidium pullulans]THY06124.1 hypothetical protein D6D03_02551 [Aureobasidium pullulans]
MSNRGCPQLAIEIQLEILEFLAEDARHEVAERQYDDAWRCYARLLLPAILVNREWALRGTDLLWREPFTPALAKIRSDRRQIYADKVQSIGLYLYRADHTGCPAAFANLKFPKLKRLEINSCPPWLMLDLRPYLSVSVTSFMMVECRHLPRSMLDLIAFCCPKLRDVHVDYDRDNQRDEHFLKFLQKGRQVRELTLGSENDLSLPVDVLENLVAGKQLQVLDAPRKFVSHHSIATVLQQNPRIRPFRNIRNLFLSIESKALAPLLSTAELLKELQLTLTDSDHDVFGPIGCLPCLETVDLCFSAPKRLAILELQAISGLSRLKDLSIYRPTRGPYQEEGTLLVAEAWTDDVFRSWICSYPELRKLQFGVSPLASHWISETRLIAESCPKLTELIMDGIHDIGAWKVSSQPLFPQLRALELGQIKPWPFSMSAEETEEHATGVALMIHQHAPKLRELHVGRDDLGTAIEQAYDKLQTDFEVTGVVMLG